MVILVLKLTKFTIEMEYICTTCKNLIALMRCLKSAHHLVACWAAEICSSKVFGYFAFSKILSWQDEFSLLKVKKVRCKISL